MRLLADIFLLFDGIQLKDVVRNATIARERGVNLSITYLQQIVAFPFLQSSLTSQTTKVFLISCSIIVPKRHFGSNRSTYQHLPFYYPEMSLCTLHTIQLSPGKHLSTTTQFHFLRISSRSFHLLSSFRSILQNTCSFRHHPHCTQFPHLSIQNELCVKQSLLMYLHYLSWPFSRHWLRYGKTNP